MYINKILIHYYCLIQNYNFIINKKHQIPLYIFLYFHIQYLFFSFLFYFYREEMGCAYGTLKDIDNVGKVRINSEQKNYSNMFGKIRSSRKLHKINGRQQIEDHKLFENVRILQGNLLTTEDQSIVSTVLKSHFFFYKIHQSQIGEILKNMISCQGQIGNYIFKQGDPATAFFIITEGSVQVWINGQPKKILKKGDYFGQLALIYVAPRSASIKVKTPAKFLCITRNTFRNTLQNFVRCNYSNAKHYIENLPIFNFLTQNQKDSIAFQMLTLKYNPQQAIFKQNDDANSFFIITKGSVQIHIKGKNNLILRVGQSFGEQAFLQEKLRGGTALARQQTICLSIGRQSIKNILGDKINNITYYNIQKWALIRSKILSSKLSTIQIQKILQTRNLINYKKGEVIYKKGQLSDKFVICLQGNISKKQRNLIGEQFLYQGQPIYIQQNLIMEEDGLLSIIYYNEIENITNKTLLQILNRKQITYEKILITEKEQQKVNDFSNLKFQNLIHIRKLGEGQFGKVHLVKQSLNSSNLYALKCIQKQQVIESKMQKIILQEKNILSIVNSPFLIKFIKSFKDHYFIYFLTQYIKGSELFDVIRQIGLLTKNVARFYIATLILSIQYLHLKNVIYRDLKPQNVMVQSNGYPKLIDMGTAKKLSQSNGFRTFTIIGTPHYMAPEVMQGKGYSFAVDIWSLGVVLYQFLCGQLPFGQQLDDPYQIHSEVIRSQIIYPSYFTDTKAKKLIQQMLFKTPELRLTKGFSGLKANQYFDGFDWEALYSKQLKSPYIPKKIQGVEKQIYEQSSIFLNVINRQKSKLKIPRQSQIKNWDADF